jgi:hypothetical protein
VIIVIHGDQGPADPLEQVIIGAIEVKARDVYEEVAESRAEGSPERVLTSEPKLCRLQLNRSQCWQTIFCRI